MIIREQLNGFVKKLMNAIKGWKKTSLRYTGNFTEVIKMVKLHSSSMFIKDPVDVFGNETTIGLVEHAVRTHAPPLLCDGRGAIKFYDDYEQPTTKFSNVSVGSSTAARSIDTCRVGSFSMKLTTGATTDDLIRCVYYTNGLNKDRIGCGTSFAPGDTPTSMENSYLSILLGYDDDAVYHYGELRLDSELGKIQIYNSAGTYTDIATISQTVGLFSNKNRWADIKLVMNVSTNKYVRAILYGIEYDISDYNIYTSASVAPRKVQGSIEIKTKEAVTHAVYVDNFIITENEPE